MSEQASVPDVKRVHGLLAAAGCPWPEPVYLQSTKSTNVEATGLIARGAVDGSCVVAGEQTAGRGRQGRSWVSEPGAGLWSSTIIRDCSHVARLPLLAALAVVDVAGELGGVAWAIKWPNDVWDESGRKVAGILVEAVDDAAVVGIGVNVERPPREFPSAGSWADSSGSSPDRSELLAGLLASLYHRVHQPWTESITDYRSLCRTLGQRVHVVLPGGQEFGGVAQDVDSSGHLLVQVGQTVRTVVAGDVVHATIAP